MLIRQERPGDVDAVRSVTAEAFRTTEGGEPAEVALLDRLRSHDCWIPALSMVAVDQVGTVVGHVVCTRGFVDGAPALGLGPIAVRPGLQRRGTGSALMHAVLGAADALGEPLVALLGDPAYH